MIPGAGFNSRIATLFSFLYRRFFTVRRFLTVSGARRKFLGQVYLPELAEGDQSGFWRLESSPYRVTTLSTASFSHHDE